MKKLLFAAVVALAMSGCAQAQAPTAPLSTDTVVKLQNDALAAKLSFQGALTIAVAYIERPRCGRPTSPPLCSDQAVVDVARQVITAGNAATQAAENAARTLTPNTTLLQALLVTAQEAATNLNLLIPKP